MLISATECAKYENIDRYLGANGAGISSYISHTLIYK